MRALFMCSIALFASHANATQFELSRTELQNMAQLSKGATLDIAALPISSQSAAKVRLKRIEIYAPGARIYRMIAPENMKLRAVIGLGLLLTVPFLAPRC